MPVGHNVLRTPRLDRSSVAIVSQFWRPVSGLDTQAGLVLPKESLNSLTLLSLASQSFPVRPLMGLFQDWG